MGQAKNRGSFEQRKAEAIERNALEAIERNNERARRKAIREANPAYQARKRKRGARWGRNPLLTAALVRAAAMASAGTIDKMDAYKDITP